MRTLLLGAALTVAGCGNGTPAHPVGAAATQGIGVRSDETAPGSGRNGVGGAVPPASEGSGRTSTGGAVPPVSEGSGRNGGGG